MSLIVDTVPVQVTSNVVGLRITCASLNFFKSACFMVDTLVDSGAPIEQKYIYLTQEEYTTWKNDDTYIINLICEKLGYTPVPQQTSSTIE
jgi:hypothetical protein